MDSNTFEEAEKSFAKYPYFVIPQIEALAQADGEERVTLMRRIAAAVGSEEDLRRIIGIDPAEFASFYPDMKSPDLTTTDTIDSFISRFSSEKAAEAPEIEELVVAPAINYTDLLDEGDEGVEAESEGLDATDDAISSFLAAVPVKKPTKKRKEPDTQLKSTDDSDSQESPNTAQPKEENPTLSEELFKIMVKNRNYSKALEIITELSLNNPKKSIYFADQIRFLQKLEKLNRKN